MPDLKEDLLQHFLTLGRVDEDASDQSEHAGRQHVVELSESRLVAVSDADKQIAGVIRRLPVLGDVNTVDNHYSPACHSRVVEPGWQARNPGEQRNRERFVTVGIRRYPTREKESRRMCNPFA